MLIKGDPWRVPPAARGRVPDARLPRHGRHPAPALQEHHAPQQGNNYLFPKLVHTRQDSHKKFHKPHLCNLLVDSILHTLYESYACPLSYGISWNDLLQEVAEWQTKMKRHACRPQESITVQSSKQNNPDLKWKQRLSQLSDCHLAVCWSWASYHTSSERGHPRLPADMKIRTTVQLIGILWSYFGVRLRSTDQAQHFGLSLGNPLKQI